MIILYLLLSYIILTEIAALIINSQKDYSNYIFTSSGCNQFDSDTRRECCIEHDKDYTRGGWIISRFKADWKLAKCVWKNKKLLSIYMFLGCRLFSMFHFAFGKKRELKYEDINS